jgi:hypothetical protein
MLQKYIFETKLEKTLSEKDKSICDGEITVTECSDAVNEMKLNKSLFSFFILFIDFLTCLFFSSPKKYELFVPLIQPTVPVPLLVPPPPLLFPDRFFSNFIVTKVYF